MENTSDLTADIRAMKVVFRAFGTGLLMVTGIFLFLHFKQNIELEYDTKMAEKFEPVLSVGWLVLLVLSSLSILFHQALVRFFTDRTLNTKQMTAVNWSAEKYRDERFAAFRSAKLIGYAVCEAPALLSLIGFFMSSSFGLIQGTDYHFYFLASPVVTAAFMFLSVPDEQMVNEVLG